jgi:hypothetical protein
MLVRRRLDFERPVERQIILDSIPPRQEPSREQSGELALGGNKRRRKAPRLLQIYRESAKHLFIETVSANLARGNAQSHRIRLHLPFAKMTRSTRGQPGARNAKSNLNIRTGVDLFIAGEL